MLSVSDETKLLYTGDKPSGLDINSESLPIFTTSAFTWHSLDEVDAAYVKVRANCGYSYIRTNNPNRNALEQAITFLEQGEASLICSSGMGAITSTLLTVLKAGDHMICSNCCYGESLDVIKDMLTKFGVEVSMVNINILDEVKHAIKDNTKVIYTEVLANPLLKVADIPALSALIHENNGLLIVDNTFTTPLGYKPIQGGTDIVINSLTKFLNGHSDLMGGSITSTASLIKKIKPVSMYCGTPGDPFSSWLVSRSLRTAELRIAKQMENALTLAAALEQDSRIAKVYHPGLESFCDHETAMRLFQSSDRICPIVSFDVVSEDETLRNEFMKKLEFVHYAPTLGGVRTTYQQPIYSSHAEMPDAERRAMGITPAMFRVSVGIENAADIIADFKQALSVFD